MSDLIGYPGRVVVFEEGSVHFIDSSEVIDISQQHRGLHNVVEGAVSGFKDLAYDMNTN